MPVLTPDREVAPPPFGPVFAVPAAPSPYERPRTEPRRLLRGLGVVVMAGLAFIGFDRIRDLIPSLANPFASETVDRTGPAVLRALEDLHRYEAATGSFQVYVDVENDARYMPDFIKGERTLFLATGTVDAGVDFSGVAGAVAMGADSRSVTITLPRATLSEPRIDPERTRVVDRDRGLLDRMGSVFSDSPTSERALYVIADRKLAVAAGEAGLLERAEENTRTMLSGLLRPLGVEQVTVEFGSPQL